MGKSYRDLLVWRRAKAYAVAIYRLTRQFPREETYGLAGQLRRAAVSIPSNIAQGQGRTTPGAFYQFLGQARGSLYELETQLEIAAELAYLRPTEASELIREASQIGRLLNALMAAIRPSPHPKRTLAARPGELRTEN